MTATFWQLRMSNVWTVPVVELVQGQPQRTAIIVADDGRQSTAARVNTLLGAGCRVIAVDPFYLGESKIAERDFLFALLLAGVGDRPIGVQASQVAAVARWSVHGTGDRRRHPHRRRAAFHDHGLDRRRTRTAGHWPT